MKLQLTCTAFQAGGLIPPKYTCDGENVSPPLSWKSIPPEAQTLAIIMDDPDAPNGTWVHWVIFNIPVFEPGLRRMSLPTIVLHLEQSKGRMISKKLGMEGHVHPRVLTGTCLRFMHWIANSVSPAE